MRDRPRILIICDYYLPGYESGGAVRTLANMVERLGDRFDFRIITRDHDGTAVRTPYPNVTTGEWTKGGNAQVYYLSKDQIRGRSLVRIIDGLDIDAIYLNSFFSRLTILFLTLAKFGRVKPTPIILAPEGEFSPGALSLNPLRKKLYIANARMLLLSKDILWKAASDEERADIEAIFGPKASISVAPNMPPKMIAPTLDVSQFPEKPAGSARMIFLSRFMRKKNFNWLLEHLHSISGDLTIDICGTLEEADYWEECRSLIAELPENIQIRSLGPIAHEKVSDTLASYDFFVLPTLGENFGHVFIEALAAGLPLVTSDRTPWRRLSEKGIGWDIPLEEPNKWTNVIQSCIDMTPAAHRNMRRTAREFAVEWLSDPGIEASNAAMLTDGAKL